MFALCNKNQRRSPAVPQGRLERRDEREKRMRLEAPVNEREKEGGVAFINDLV